jgi:hypothetical protein
MHTFSEQELPAVDLAHNRPRIKRAGRNSTLEWLLWGNASGSSGSNCDKRLSALRRSNCILAGNQHLANMAPRPRLEPRPQFGSPKCAQMLWTAKEGRMIESHDCRSCTRLTTIHAGTHSR